MRLLSAALVAVLAAPQAGAAADLLPLARLLPRLPPSLLPPVALWTASPMLEGLEAAMWGARPDRMSLCTCHPAQPQACSLQAKDQVLTSQNMVSCAWTDRTCSCWDKTRRTCSC